MIPARSFVETSAANQPLPPSQMRRVVDGNNLLLGAVRLVQVRVRSDSCDVPDLFTFNGSSAVSIPHCYAEWPSAASSFKVWRWPTFVRLLYTTVRPSSVRSIICCGRS